MSNRVVVHVACRVPRGDSFERGPDRIDLDEVGRRDFSDSRSSKRLADDESEEFKVAECFSHGSLADTHLLGDPRFNDAVAGLQVAAKDGVEQELLDVFAEDAASRPIAGFIHRESPLAHNVNPSMIDNR